MQFVSVEQLAAMDEDEALATIRSFSSLPPEVVAQSQAWAEEASAEHGAGAAQGQPAAS